jgi:diguanylate cyclase
LIGLLLVCTIVHVVLYQVDPANARLRLTMAPFTVAAWVAACGAALVATAEGYERSAHWLTAALFFTWGVFEVVRGVYALLVNDPTTSLLGENAVYSVSLMVGFIGIIGTSLGFILMTKERSDLEIIRIASVDPLTGLWNRRTFDAAAETELQRAAREKRPLSVLMIDIDHFKHVNDTYGHPVGDAVLQSFATVLEDAVRPFDVSSRYGGEEFCVLLIGTGLEEGRGIAERIRRLASERRVFGGKDSVSYTVSVGVAQVPEHATTIDGAVAAADHAMYRVKESGRNRVEVYPGDPVAS